MTKIDLKQLAEEGKIEKTHLSKRLAIAEKNEIYPVYRIPLKYLYYNDQNGRINTLYHKYIAANGKLLPEAGDSKFNKIFEGFIVESKKGALKTTQESIKIRGQQEVGVVLTDGRVIDGNRRFTALRRLQREDRIEHYFEGVILSLDINNKIQEKKIKQLELDLQLAREERVNYDPIDRIFDVYKTIKVEKLMTPEEYKKASGAKSTKGINRDLRLADLIVEFLNIISPGAPAEDRFYLARELKLDGPIEEIERELTKLKKDRSTITTNVLTTIAVMMATSDSGDGDITRKARDIINNVLKKPEIKKHYIEATDSHVDNVIDYLEEHPVKSAGDLKKNLEARVDIADAANKLLQTTKRLTRKGGHLNERRQALTVLEDTLDRLTDLNPEDFEKLNSDEKIEAKDILREIRDAAYKLSEKGVR